MRLAGEDRSNGECHMSMVQTGHQSCMQCQYGVFPEPYSAVSVFTPKHLLSRALFHLLLTSEPIPNLVTLTFPKNTSLKAMLMVLEVLLDSD